MNHRPDDPAPRTGQRDPRRASPMAAGGAQPLALWRQLVGVAGALSAIRGGQSGTAALQVAQKYFTIK